MAVAACEPPPASDPATEAREFIKLARAGKCAEAFPRYTAASQKNLRDLSNKFKENTPYHTEANEAYRLHCHVFADYLPKTATLATQTGDTAYINVIQRTGSYIPIPFFSDPIKETPVKITMARENGEWKVVAPYVQVEDPDRHELKVGKFKVEWPRQPATDVHGFRTYGTLNVPPEGVEAVMLDFKRWPAWMPAVVEARVLKEPADTARLRKYIVYVRHAANADAPPVEFVIEFTNNARTSDGGRRAFTGSWRALKNTVFEAGHSKLATVWGVSFSAGIASANTTEMRFGYAALPAEWPPELRSVVFEPQYGPALMAAIELEAMRISGALPKRDSR